MDFDPVTGTLWGALLRGGDSSNPADYFNNLVTINPATGALVNIGVTVSGMEALAIAIPEPAAYAGALGAVALGLVMRRAKRGAVGRAA